MTDKSKYYINEEALYDEMLKWKKQLEIDEKTQMPEPVAKAVMLIANNLAKRYNFNGYTSTWKDEMIGDAIEYCLRYLKNFDPYKYNKPYSYITQICYNAFKQRLKKEKKALTVKYKVFTEQAMDFDEDPDNNEHSMNYEYYLSMVERVSEYENNLNSKREEKETKSRNHQILEKFS